MFVKEADQWLGYPVIPGFDGILYSVNFSPDDGKIHSVRLTAGDIHAPRPHFNLEAGMWEIKQHGGLTFKVDRVGNIKSNLHLYFR